MTWLGCRVGLTAAFAQCWMLAVWAHTELQVREDGTFKIALFCDMHYGESLSKDLRSSQFQRTMLKLEQPSLVVIDGDASSNYAAPPCNASNASVCQEWFDIRWKNFTQPLEESKTPYAYTLGNHDRIPGATSSPAPGIETDYVVPDHWIMRKDETNPHSLTKDGPTSIHGASNYVLPITGPSGQRVAYVWLLDSSDNSCMGKTGWGCVYPDQVEWYRQTSKRLIQQDGGVLPGVMFHHIPLDEVNTAWNDPSVDVNGTKGEDVCCFSANTGLFEAVREVGNVWGIFHGHDHNNDFIALYKGIRIGFGRKSGFGGYGGKVADRPGSRIVQLRWEANGTVTWDTWIRELEGTKVIQPRAIAPRSPRAAACCGTVTALRKLSGVEQEPLEAARHACRVDDDAGACRAAVGLGGLRAKAPLPSPEVTILA